MKWLRFDNNVAQIRRYGCKYMNFIVTAISSIEYIR